MNISTKKLANGFELPVYGLGTWQMGGRYNVDTTNDHEEINAIKSALDLGITHIDTAESYANGHAEQLVAAAMQHYQRDTITLVSKVSSSHLQYDDVIESCKTSLSRLKTNYIDVYLIHRPSETIPLEETMPAFDFLIQEGLIKNIGISNASKETLAKAQSLTKNKIVCNQVHYNLMVRDPETSGLLEYCQQNDVLLVAYRPVQKGIITDAKTELMDQLAKKYQKTYAQIAINWLISQSHVVTIAKTSSLNHLQENLGGTDWEMEHEDIELLRTSYPNQLTMSDVGPLQ